MLFWVNVLSDILEIFSKNLAQSRGKQRFKRIIPNVNDQSLLANLIMLKINLLFCKKIKAGYGPGFRKCIFQNSSTMGPVCSSLKLEFAL